jgi:hypothetical protein
MPAFFMEEHSRILALEAASLHQAFKYFRLLLFFTFFTNLDLNKRLYELLGLILEWFQPTMRAFVC